MELSKNQLQTTHHSTTIDGPKSKFYSQSRIPLKDLYKSSLRGSKIELTKFKWYFDNDEPIALKRKLWDIASAIHTKSQKLH